jgi:hypothetical protein
MFDVDDDTIDREASPDELARIAAIIRAEPRFAVFATGSTGGSLPSSLTR